METIAQLLLLLVAFALLKAYLDGGGAGVRQWLRAKVVGA